MQTLILITTLMLGVLPSDATNARVEYVAAGGTQFTFSFKTLSTSHVKVYKNDVLQSTGYSTSLNANQDSSPGGAVTFTTAPVSGTRVKIERTLPVANESAWTAFSRAKSLELDLDRTAMRDQQIERRMNDLAVGALPASTDASSLTVGASNTTTPLELRTWLSGEVNVLAFGAVPNDGVSDTSAIQAAIAAAGDGTVYIPDGDYIVTGVTTTKSTSIRGAGWRKTRLVNDSAAHPTITVEGTGVFGLGTYELGGPTFEHFQIMGTSTGTAVEYNTQTRTRFHRVMITGSYSKGFHIAPRSHAYGLTIDGCFIYALGNATTGASGVYGRSYPDKQVNAVTITGGTEIQAVKRKADGTLGHGINLWANVVNVKDSIIEGNEGTGIYIDASDLTSPVVSQVNTYNITGNYLEGNWDGAIVGSTAYNAGTGLIRSVWNLTIRDNMINAGTAGSTLSPSATAMIDLDNTDGAGGASAVTSAWKGAIIGPNYYFGASGTPYVNLHGRSDYTVSVVAPGTYTGLAFGSKFIGMGTVRVEDDFFQIDPSAPTTGAAYVGQMFQQTSPPTWWKAKAVTGAAADWQPLAVRASIYGDRGDGDALLSPGVSAAVQWWGTPLTAHRTITFSATTYTGATFRIVRTAAATGAFNLYVGTAGAVATLSAAKQWCDVTYNGSAWMLTGYGTLP